MAELKELREKQAKLVADARAKLGEIVDDTNESRAREIETEYDAIMAEHDRIESRAKRLEDLIERENALNTADPRRPGQGDDEQRSEERGAQTIDERRAAAFKSYLLYGAGEMPAEQRQLLREMRAQSAVTDGSGGYTVPQGFVAELIVSMVAWGPMLDPGVTRQLVTASGNQLEVPTMNDTSNQAVRLAENTAATNEGDLAFGQKVLDAYKYSSGPILVSSELLQDSAFDIEELVRSAMAERFGRKVNADLTVGDGVGDPNGIVVASTLGKTAASATAITFDELIDLQHAVDPAYRTDPSVGWQFNDTVLKLVRKLKDGQGNYLWSPADARTGAPATLLGNRYSINQAMANPTTGQKSVLFGAMNRYWVRRVKEVAIRRLNERYAEADQVGFIGFARYDGELMDTAAVKHLIQA